MFCSAPFTVFQVAEFCRETEKRLFSLRDIWIEQGQPQLLNCEKKKKKEKKNTRSHKAALLKLHMLGTKGFVIVQSTWIVIFL